MSVASLLNQSMDVYRNAATSGSKKQYSKVSSVQIMIQPMSASAADHVKIAFTRAYIGYVLRIANVLIGDYLQDSTGNKYDVEGIRDWNLGSQPYLELTLNRQTQQGQK